MKSENAVGNPQPAKLEMLGELTVYMRPPTAAADADADVDAIKRGGQVVKWDAPELYFHQLRLRIALEPELAKRIAVVYIDAPDSHRKVGLAFEDELRWPVGFCNEAWNIESKIGEARGRTSPQTIPSQGKRRHDLDCAQRQGNDCDCGLDAVDCSCPDAGCHPAEMAGKVCRRTAQRIPAQNSQQEKS